jgi:hypothetical protein
LATAQKFANANAASTGAGFTNPTNAYADDGSFATCAPAKNGGIGSDYGFPAFAAQDIPDGATINSVAVEIQYRSSTTASANASMRLQLENGTLLGSEQSGGMSTTDVTLTHSVASGVALGDLRGANGVQARVTGRRGNSNTAITWSVDYVRLTVDYTPAIVGAGTAGLTLGASGTGVVEDAGVTGDGLAALALVASGQAVLPVAGTGTVGLGIAALGSGSVAVAGAGGAPLAVGLSAAASVSVAGAGSAGLVVAASGAGSAPVSGAGAAALSLSAGGTATAPVAGAGAAALALAAGGSGGSPATIGDGEVGLVLVGSGAGTLPVAGDGSALFGLEFTGSGSVRVIGAGLAPLAAAVVATGTAAPDPEAVVAGNVLVELDIEVELAAVLEVSAPVARIAGGRQSAADLADRLLGRSPKPWRRRRY